MWRKRSAAVWSLVVLSLGLIFGVMACKEPASPQGTTPPSPPQSSEQRPPSSTASPQTAQPRWRPTPSPALQALMLRAQTQCQISGAGSRPRGCPELDDELDAMTRQLGLEALETLLWGLEHEHEQTRALSAWLIQANITQAHLEALTREPATEAQLKLSAALLEALARYDSSEAGTHLWASVAVDLGMLTQQGALVGATLQALKDEQTRANATRALMRFGRTSAFELVKAQAQDKSQPMRVRAALDAPLQMQGWSDQERELLCPWYLTFLPDLSRDYTERPAQAMRRCGGLYLDHLLDELERRVKAHTFDRPFSFAIRQLLTEQPTDKLLIPTPKQLARARALLVQATKDEQLVAGARAFAMSTLTQRWPDPQTEQLLTQLSLSDSPGLAAEAKEALALLISTRQLKATLNKTQPPKAPTPAP